MDNVIVIDAKKRLGPNSIQKFKENQSDDTNVVMYIEDTEMFFERPLKEMRSFFEDESVEQAVLNDDCVISFITDEKILTILGLDFNWWIAVVRNKKYRRLDKLFGEQVVEKEQKKERQKKEKIDAFQSLYKCACANLDNGVLKDIETFEGSYKDMIIFINKANAMKLMRSFFKASVVFCINYSEDKDLENVDNWFTVEELKEKGVFVQ